MSGDDSQDRRVPVDSPEVPAGVRGKVLNIMRPGDVLWRCPRLGAPQGALGLLGVGRRDVMTEWWLVSEDGELIEAFWET